MCSTRPGGDRVSNLAGNQVPGAFEVDTTTTLCPARLTGLFSYSDWNFHYVEWHTMFEMIDSTGNNSPVEVLSDGSTRTFMAHWTNDPKIHSLMTQLGKTGKTGKPTRAAHVAEQVSQIMVKVEPRVAELRVVSKDHDELFILWDKLKDLLANKKRHIDNLRLEFEQAKEDILQQNPNADISMINRELRQALTDLDDEFRNAAVDIDDVKQSIRVKRSTMRGIEDRMEKSRKLVLRQMMQLKQPRQKAG